MKKFSIALVVVAIAVAGFLFYQSTQCQLDGTNVCYDSTSQRFLVEENARVSVQVENQKIADYLQREWETLYPNTALEIEVKPVLDVDTLASMPNDIMVANQTEAVFFMGELLNMGRDMSDVVGSRIPILLQDAVNLKGFYMAQNSVSGPLFVKNKTLMDALSITSIDTFDELFALKDKVLESQESVMSFSFLDQRSFYPFLTAGSWILNPTHVGTESGYDSEQFLKGLEFISELSKQRLFANKDHKASDLKWNYESDLFSNNTILSLIEDREFARLYAEANGTEFVYTESPSYQGTRLAPRAEVRGYVVRKSTEFPSASTEVVRILRSPNVVNLNDFTDTYVPIYHMNHVSELEFNASQLAMIRAYNFSDAVSVLGLETDPNVLARRVYQEVEIMDVLMRLYDGELDALQAQAEIVERTNRWYQQFVTEESS